MVFCMADVSMYAYLTIVFLNIYHVNSSHLLSKNICKSPSALCSSNV